MMTTKHVSVEVVPVTWCKLRPKYTIHKVVQTRFSPEGLLLEDIDYVTYSSWEYVTIRSCWSWPSYLPGKLGKVVLWLENVEELLELPRRQEEQQHMLQDQKAGTAAALIKSTAIRYNIQAWLARHWETFEKGNALKKHFEEIKKLVSYQGVVLDAKEMNKIHIRLETVILAFDYFSRKYKSTGIVYKSSNLFGFAAHYKKAKIFTSQSTPKTRTREVATVLPNISSSRTAFPSPETESCMDIHEKCLHPKQHQISQVDSHQSNNHLTKSVDVHVSTSRSTQNYRQCLKYIFKPKETDEFKISDVVDGSTGKSCIANDIKGRLQHWSSCHCWKKYRWRLLWTLLPFIILLLALLWLSTLVPLTEEDYRWWTGCCNNMKYSWYPMLRYTNGPPPF